MYISRQIRGHQGVGLSGPESYESRFSETQAQKEPENGLKSANRPQSCRTVIFLVKTWQRTEALFRHGPFQFNTLYSSTLETE